MDPFDWQPSSSTRSTATGIRGDLLVQKRVTEVKIQLLFRYQERDLQVLGQPRSDQCVADQIIGWNSLGFNWEEKEV